MSERKFNGIDESVLESWANKELNNQEKSEEAKVEITDSQIEELEALVAKAESQIQMLQAKCDYLKYLLSEAKRLKEQNE